MSTSGDLERMKSLSSAGHHGGVRVFNDTREIARGLAAYMGVEKVDSIGGCGDFGIKGREGCWKIRVLL